mgnify:FL=1|jgi:hypothetical protein
MYYEFVSEHGTTVERVINLSVLLSGKIKKFLKKVLQKY